MFAAGLPGAAVGGYGAVPRADRASHAGRGPRNYQRSDERITEDVCRRLTDDADVDASEIIVRVEKGVVTLTGSVDDRYQRRAAEDAVGDIWGVREVRNEIHLHSSRRVLSGPEDRNVSDTAGTPVRQP
jgi:osmotically-inducible protein OsmY